MELKHSGFVAVVGRPSSGKSTFLNTLCGIKVSIVSKTPQTTRNKIRAIYNSDDMQIIFIDTPGMHFSERSYNLELVNVAKDALNDGDAVLYMSDLSRSFGSEEKMILEMLAQFAGKTIVALNKADLVSIADIEVRKQEIMEILKPVDFVILSALNKGGTVKLANRVAELVPAGPQLYPDDYYTDQDQEFRITEVIREKIFASMRQEIPHSCYVTVDSINFDEARDLITINALIFTEAESQKSMIIGKKGSVIKRIGTESRSELKEIFGRDINLFLKVKTHPGWRKDAAFLKKFFN